MADFVNFDDLFRAARDEILAKNGKITRTVIERDGTDANVLVAGASGAADEVLKQLLGIEAGLFLDTAKGADLDRLVFDRYGLLRKPAAAAIGEVQFSTLAPNPATFVVPANTIVSSASGVQYVTTSAVAFPASSVGPVSAPIRSVLAGIDQQAAIGTITSIVSQIIGQPADLKVTNALATAGADDAELDDSLRARARAFFTTARRGTIAAIEQGALAIPGVRTANVFEILDSSARPARIVQLVVSDAFTVALAATNPPSYQVQSQALAATVFAGLSNVRAAGIFVDVIVAQVILLPIELHLTFAAGADVVLATAEAKAIAINYTNTLNPGQTFKPSELVDLLRAVSDLVVTGSEVFNPNGDVVPLPLQALRTEEALVIAPAG